MIHLTRDGRRLTAIVPAEVAAEITAAEDAADIVDAEAGMAEPGEDIPAEVSRLHWASPMTRGLGLRYKLMFPSGIRAPDIAQKFMQCLGVL